MILAAIRKRPPEAQQGAFRQKKKAPRNVAAPEGPTD